MYSLGQNVCKAQKERSETPQSMYILDQFQIQNVSEHERLFICRSAQLRTICDKQDSSVHTMEDVGDKFAKEFANDQNRAEDTNVRTPMQKKIRTNC